MGCHLDRQANLNQVPQGSPGSSRTDGFTSSPKDVVKTPPYFWGRTEYIDSRERKEKCRATSGTRTHDSRSRAQVFNNSATSDPTIMEFTMRIYRNLPYRQRDMYYSNLLNTIQYRTVHMCFHWTLHSHFSQEVSAIVMIQKQVKSQGAKGKDRHTVQQVVWLQQCMRPIASPESPDSSVCFKGPQ